MLMVWIVVVGIASLLAGLGLALGIWHSRNRQKLNLTLDQIGTLARLTKETGGIRSEVKAFLTSSAVFPRLLEMLQSRQLSIKLNAMKTLSSIDGPAVVEPLLSQLFQSDPAIRDAAVASLTSLEDPSALDLILSRWSDYPMDLVAEALSRKGPGVVPKVGPLVTHASASVRAYSVEVLRRIKSTESARFIADALRDPQPAVRANAAAALGEAHAGYVGPLVQSLFSDPAPEVRCQASLSLGKLGSPDAAQALSKAFVGLGDVFLPWDSTVLLWKAYKNSLEEMGALDSTLRSIADLKPDGLDRWFRIAVTAGDMDVVFRAVEAAPQTAEKGRESLVQAVLLHGEDFVFQRLVSALSGHPPHLMGARTAMQGMRWSKANEDRLAAEFKGVLDGPGRPVWDSGTAVTRERQGSGSTINNPEVKAKAEAPVTAPSRPENLESLNLITMGPVLVMDEEPRRRHMTRTQLERQGLAVLGEAGDPQEVNSMLESLPAHTVVICSASFPGALWILRDLMLIFPEVGVVLVSNNKIDVKLFQSALPREPRLISDTQDNRVVMEAISGVTRRSL